MARVHNRGPETLNPNPISHRSLEGLLQSLLVGSPKGTTFRILGGLGFRV